MTADYADKLTSISTPSPHTIMATRNAGSDKSPKTLASASASQHDSEAPSDFGDSPPPSQVSLPPFGSQPNALFESDYDIVLPAPLDSGTTVTSALPPLAGPSSLKTPKTDADKASGIKRKQDSEDIRASQAEDNSIERKRPKRESLDDGASLFMAPGHTSDVADPDSTVHVCAATR
jgi:hypothetical protein